MPCRQSVLALVLLASAAPLAQAPAVPAAPAPEASSLPVRRVVLYKTGVGYFEHLGRVRDRQDVAIRFTSAQLDDVLKSLTTIDLGAGQVTGISYNSVAPIEQRLDGLRLPLGRGATTLELLSGLRGAQVEVTAGGGAPVSGRVFGVERHLRERNGSQVPIDTLAIVTAAGEIRSIELSPAVRLRIADAGLRQEIARYLDVVGSVREEDVRRMVISTAGSGERQLFVSYVSEVPIWKSTYRLVLRGAAPPLLQGWAIVDNTVGEDWTGVELSLVAGAPQSFVQNVSQPYYGRRPTVPLPRAALLTPQTHEAAIAHYGSSTEVPASATARGATRDAVEPRVGGLMGGVVGGLPGGPPPPPAPAAPLSPPPPEPAAAAAALGDLFEYRIKEPVTLRKNQSALVPIVSAAVAVEKVALWNRPHGSGRPLRAVWLTNTSALTLDGGSIAVIDGNAFAGEGLIEPMKPGERRLLSYAADVGVLMAQRAEDVPGRLLRIRARDGMLIQEHETRAAWTYSARSEEAAPVTVVIEHRRRPGWTLAPGLEPVESTPDAYRFRLVVEPGREASLTIRESHTGEVRHLIGDLTEPVLSQLVTAGGPSGALERALAPVMAGRAAVAAIEAEIAVLEARHRGIADDQQRLRENMKALRGSAEERTLLRRYARQLDDQENELARLRTALAGTALRRDKARADFTALVAAFAVDLD